MNDPARASLGAVLRAAALCLLALFSVATAWAADQTTIPALAVVPDSIEAARRATLLRQRQSLETELKSFQAAGAAFNAKPAEEQTDQEYDALSARRTRYIGAATSFNQQVDAAVVDARNVPSPLPPSVDAEIPHTPNGDRVRKGYQGIQSHDWKVALAWFQEAARYAPDDAGIARLVDLAQSAVDARSRPAVQRYLETRTDAQFQAQWTAFVTDYLPGHPEMTARLRAALDAADGRGKAAARPSAAAIAQRVADLRRRAAEFDERAMENMGYSFLLPGDQGAEGQRMRDVAVMNGETADALLAHARAIEQCRCEPPLQLPAGSDIKFLFPGMTDAIPDRGGKQ